MPTNTHTESCIRTERGALVFSAPGSGRLRDGSRVQIVDVFALQVATGYTRDPQGRLLREAQPSVAAGRSWSLAKAAQLIRNDARPHPLAQQAGLGFVLGWLRWVPFIGQFWALKSSTPGGRNRVWSQCRRHGESFLPVRCGVLHGSTSTGIGTG